MKQSGQSSRTGALSKAGSKALRWAAVRGRPAGLARDEPVASAPPRRRQPSGQNERRQGGRRPQGTNRRLARPLPQRALQAVPPQRHRPCPGKLPLSSGRLTAWSSTASSAAAAGPARPDPLPQIDERTREVQRLDRCSRTPGSSSPRSRARCCRFRGGDARRALREPLAGRFSGNQALARLADPRPHRLEEGIATLSARIEEQLAPFADKG